MICMGGSGMLDLVEMDRMRSQSLVDMERTGVLGLMGIDGIGVLRFMDINRIGQCGMGICKGVGKRFGDMDRIMDRIRVLGSVDKDWIRYHMYGCYVKFCLQGMVNLDLGSPRFDGYG